MRHKFKFQLLAVLALALAGMAIGLSQASAHGNGHGGLRFSDADGDGASDKCEVRTGTSSTDTDSDDNGVVDGLEDTDGDGANNAAESVLRSNCSRANTAWKTIRRAEVKSYSDGTLTLSIGNKGGLLAAPVSTRVLCEIDDPDESEDSDDNSASITRHGADDGPGDDRGGRGRGDDDRGGRFGRFDGDDDTVACVTGDLAEGATVKKAKVRNGKFTRIHLADPDDSE